MMFAPALSLGVASLGEMVDVKIAADLDPAAIAAELGKGAPDGISFTGGVALGPQDAALPRVIDSARYLVVFARSALEGERGEPDKRGEPWLAAEVERFLGMTEQKVLRRIDGIGKWVDVRSFVRRVAIGGAEGDELAARVGLVGDLVTLLVDVEIRGSGSVKVAEVVEAIAGADVPHRAVRVSLGTWVDGAIASPLDLAAVRKPPKPAAETEPEPALAL